MPYIKHVFKYQEYRKTQFLNTMAKDDLGRHRGGVLYGMKLIPKSAGGNSIYVDSGALYTPYGTKIFWDAPATALGAGIGVINLDAVLLEATGQPVMGSANIVERPIIVAVVAELPADTPTETQPQIENAGDLTGVTPPITFKAFASTYRQDTARPGFYLFAHHPVDMVNPDPGSGWTGADAGQSDQALRTADSSLAGGAAIRPAASPGINAALKVNQILIGYIIIGGTSGSTPLTIGTDVWAPGITYVPVMNPWQTLQSLLGADPLMGRTEGLVDGGVADALNPSTGAVSQAAIGRKMATGAANNLIPLGVPRFGTPAVDSAGYEATWSTYRFPNFVRDGDNLLESLRRMDYLLRLWMDKTGDQGLVRSVQDGTAGYLSRFASLEGILYQMDGSAISTHNLNTANWASDNDLPLSIASDAFADQPSHLASATVATVDGDTVYNHVLKPGMLTHIPSQLDITTMQGAGDSHRQAIRALDVSMFHFLHDILGVDIRRSWLRLPTAWTGSQPLPAWSDLPAGLPVDNTSQPNVQSGFPLRPTILVNGSLSGMTAADFNIYLGTEKIKTAIEEVAKRSSQNHSPNLLKNPVFAKSGTFSNPGTPLNWLVDGGTTWQLIPNTGGTGVARRFSATLTGTTGYLRQYTDLTSNPELLGAILDSGVISISVSLAQLTAGVVYVGLKLLDGAAPGGGVNDLVSVGGYVKQTGTTEANGYTTFTFALKLPAMRNTDGTATAARTTLLAAVKSVGIEVINPDSGAKVVSIAGAYLGCGMPPMAPMAEQNYFEFLSRDGGADSVMRGPLYMGQHQVKDVSPATDPTDVPLYVQTLHRATADDDFDAQGKKVTHAADGAVAQDLVTLAQLMAATETIFPAANAHTGRSGPASGSIALDAGTYEIMAASAGGGGGGGGGSYNFQNGTTGSPGTATVLRFRDAAGASLLNVHLAPGEGGREGVSARNGAGSYPPAKGGFVLAAAGSVDVDANAGITVDSHEGAPFTIRSDVIAGVQPSPSAIRIRPCALRRPKALCTTCSQTFRAPQVSGVSCIHSGTLARPADMRSMPSSTPQ